MIVLFNTFKVISLKRTIEANASNLKMISNYFQNHPPRGCHHRYMTTISIFNHHDLYNYEALWLGHCLGTHQFMRYSPSRQMYAVAFVYVIKYRLSPKILDWRNPYRKALGQKPVISAIVPFYCGHRLITIIEITLPHAQKNVFPVLSMLITQAMS
jgi:hypothetical protein